MTPGPRHAPRQPAPSTGRRDEVVGVVLAWWAEARVERDRLPWRSTRDPWEVLVAETMLAQTQVARAASRYRAFLDRFPTPEACASSGAGEVVRSWAGLGYNRRAVALHRAACSIVERHAGLVPRTLAELEGLPGVGPYTARAVLATAYGIEAAVVDTNVGRVLARALAGTRLRPAAAQQLADSLVPEGLAREWNLALMDLGSLLCRSVHPGCGTCPLAGARLCAWLASGAADDPARGSAGVTTRQSPFAGSDREGRGRLVDAARRAPVARGEVAAAAGWPDDPDRAARVVSALVADGVLAEAADGSFRLP